MREAAGGKGFVFKFLLKVARTDCEAQHLPFHLAIKLLYYGIRAVRAAAMVQQEGYIEPVARPPVSRRVLRRLAHQHAAQVAGVAAKGGKPVLVGCEPKRGNFAVARHLPRHLCRVFIAVLKRGKHGLRLRTAAKGKRRRKEGKPASRACVRIYNIVYICQYHEERDARCFAKLRNIPIKSRFPYKRCWKTIRDRFFHEPLIKKVP